MLPALPMARHRAAVVIDWLRLRLAPPACALLLTLVLITPLALGGCSGRDQPSAAVVQSALTLQIQLTQDAIAEALQVKPPGAAEVHHVRIAQREGVRIGDGRGLRLTGQFDWRLPGDPERTDSPFEIYLQRGERHQSWRLARPSGGPDAHTQTWLSDPLPL